MNRIVTLIVFLILVLGGGTLIGTLTMPGPWYEALAKPSFNPPNWVFGPAWTILYILIAIAGWRTFHRNAGGTAMKVWVLQLVLNFLWSPVFFALHSIEGALVIVAGMLASILAFIAASWNRDRTAALLFFPYAAWVAFATTLNAAIAILN